MASFWTRMSEDDILREQPSEQSEVLGLLRKTFGVKLLGKDGRYLKVFSPDINRNGYVLEDNVLNVDYFVS